LWGKILRTIRIGGRKSALAVAQSDWVKRRIEASFPGTNVVIVPIDTRGDERQGEPLMSMGGKGHFTEELEAALLNCKIDIAVHSLKDVPDWTNEDLPVIALSKREDPRDAIILPIGKDKRLKGPPPFQFDGVLGTSSLRRMLQARRLFQEDMRMSAVRGNVNSRLSKLDSGEFDVLLLASAGLIRLGLQNRISRILEINEMAPAAGQGILAVQGRRGEDYSLVKEAVHDLDSHYEYLAENSFIKASGATCTSPVGVFAKKYGAQIHMRAIIADYYAADPNAAGVRAAVLSATNVRAADPNAVDARATDPYIFENIRTGELTISVEDAEKAGEMLLKIMR